MIHATRGSPVASAAPARPVHPARLLVFTVHFLCTLVRFALLCSAYRKGEGAGGALVLLGHPAEERRLHERRRRHGRGHPHARRGRLVEGRVLVAVRQEGELEGPVVHGGADEENLDVRVGACVCCLRVFFGLLGG